MFCLRVMVGVIILYDHVHPVGAFAKSSPIDVSTSVILWLSWFVPYLHTDVFNDNAVKVLSHSLCNGPISETVQDSYSSGPFKSKLVLV